MNALTPYQKTIARLATAKVDSPRLEARLLIASVLKTESDNISDKSFLDLRQTENLETLIRRRENHEPLDKIIGQKYFYKSSFEVNKNVLSPRPDTEILVETAIGYALKNAYVTVADFGTGSGCILLSILADCPRLTGTGIERSKEALVVAERNTQALGLEDQTRLIEADWHADDFLTKVHGPFDLIVGNPPYIPTNDIETLDREVRCFDPLSALDGGQDGLNDYRKLALLFPKLLSSNGIVCLEIGYGQSQDVIGIFEKQGFQNIDIVRDLAGIERCLVFRLA